MTEEAVEKATGQEPPQAGTPEPVETVPLKDLLAHKDASKRRETKLRGEVDELKSQLSTLSSELEYLKTTPGVDATDEEIKAVKQALLKKNRELGVKMKDVESRAKEIADRERQIEIKSLAAQYGVSAEDIAEADDPEKEALRLALKKQKGAPNGADKGKPLPKFERGSPDRAAKAVSEMSPAEFNEYLAQQKRSASLRR